MQESLLPLVNTSDISGSHHCRGHLDAWGLHGRTLSQTLSLCLSRSLVFVLVLSPLRFFFTGRGERCMYPPGTEPLLPRRANLLSVRSTLFDDEVIPWFRLVCTMQDSLKHRIRLLRSLLPGLTHAEARV